MTRDDVRDLLIDYLDGTLPAGTAAHVSSRLAEDPLLREELEALREAEAAAKSLPRVKAPRDFLARINAAIDAEAFAAPASAPTPKAAPSNGSAPHGAIGAGGATARPGGARVLLWRAPPRTLAMAAMLLLGIGIGLVYQSILAAPGSVRPERMSSAGGLFEWRADTASVAASAPAAPAGRDREGPAKDDLLGAATFSAADDRFAPQLKAAPTTAKGAVGRMAGGRSLPDARGHSAAEFEQDALTVQRFEPTRTPPAPPGAPTPSPVTVLAPPAPSWSDAGAAPAPYAGKASGPEPVFVAEAVRENKAAPSSKDAAEGASAAVSAAQAAAFAEAEEQLAREEELLEALALAEETYRRRAAEVELARRSAAAPAPAASGEAKKALADQPPGGGAATLSGVTIAGAPREELRDGAAALAGAPQATVLVQLSGVEESVARARLAEVMAANDVRNFAWVAGDELAPSSPRGVVVLETDALQSHRVLDDVVRLGRVELARDDGVAVSAVTRALENRRSQRGLGGSQSLAQSRGPSGGDADAETRKLEDSAYEEGRSDHAKAAAEKAVQAEVERQRLVDAQKKAEADGAAAVAREGALGLTQTAEKAPEVGQAAQAPLTQSRGSQARRRASGANRAANQAGPSQQAEADPSQRVILLIEVRPDAPNRIESPK